MSSKTTKNITSWSTLPINKFHKLYQLNKQEATDERPFEIVGILNDMTLEQVYDMKLDEVHELMNNTIFLDTKPKIKKPQKQYIINGRKYDVFLNEKDITVSQYMDFQHLANNVEEHLAQFLSIFFIPEGKTYNNGYNIEYVQNELANHLDVETALSLTRFFFRKFKKSIMHMRIFSQALITVLKRKTDSTETKEQLMKLEKLMKEMPQIPILDIYG